MVPPVAPAVDVRRISRPDDDADFETLPPIVRRFLRRDDKRLHDQEVLTARLELALDKVQKTVSRGAWLAFSTLITVATALAFEVIRALR